MSTRLPPVPPAGRPRQRREEPDRMADAKDRAPPEPVDRKQAKHGAVEQNTRNTGYKQDR